MYVENNEELADIIRASCAAGRAASRALDAAVQAQVYARKVDDMYKTIRKQLDEIKAKKQLKIRLTAKERAVWTLYGEVK